MIVNKYIFLNTLAYYTLKVSRNCLHVSFSGCIVHVFLCLCWQFSGDDSGKVTIWNMAPVKNEEDEMNENIPKLLCQMDNHLGGLHLIKLLCNQLSDWICTCALRMCNYISTFCLDEYVTYVLAAEHFNPIYFCCV